MTNYSAGIRAFREITVNAPDEDLAAERAESRARSELPTSWTTEGVDVEAIAADGGEKWDFSPGDVLAEEHPTSISQGGVEVHTTEGEEYEVLHRLISPDTDDRFYYVEQERAGETHQTLMAASMVENIYEKVDSNER